MIRNTEYCILLMEYKLYSHQISSESLHYNISECRLLASCINGLNIILLFGNTYANSKHDTYIPVPMWVD